MAKARANAKESNLRLVSNFSSRSYPCRYTIDPDEDLSQITTADIDTLKQYIHQTISELEIEDYRVFTSDNTIDIFFTNTADRDEFETAYNNRDSHTVEVHLKMAHRHSHHYTENVAQELTELARELGLDHDIRFDILQNENSILMTASNRKTWLTFVEAYESMTGVPDLMTLVAPESLPYLMP